jgi:hypothetical protein
MNGLLCNYLTTKSYDRRQQALTLEFIRFVLFRLYKHIYDAFTAKLVSRHSGHHRNLVRLDDPASLYPKET